jgi:hypothetical protein
VGFALSGGGIRSATFCLGVFRALARHGLVRKIDVLSTVSGGGYFGAFLGALFTRRHDGKEVSDAAPAAEAGKPGVLRVCLDVLSGRSAAATTARAREEAERLAKPSAAYVEETLLDLQSPPVRWLRENGRYMSPNGSGDILLAGAVVLRNWVALLLVLCTFVLTILAGAALLGAYGQAAAQRVLPEGAPSFLAAYFHLAFAAVLWATVVVPAGWAFWFTQGGRMPPWVVAVVALALPLGARLQGATGTLSIALWAIAAQALLALAWWQGTRLWLDLTAPAPDDGSPRSPRLLRNRLSRTVSIGLWLSAVAVAFAVIDWTGGTALAWARTHHLRPLLGAGTAATLLAALQRVVPKLIPQDRDQRIPLMPQLLSGLAAAALVSLLLVSLSAVVHVVGCPEGLPSCRRLLVLFVVGLLLTLASAFSTPFLNLSSHHGLYGARLTRAYLGASNRNRHGGASPITDLVPGDEVTLAQYKPYENGGPLHIVNVTLNETVSGRSQIEQRDRKGLGMAVGPAGISVGTRHHTLWGAERDGALVSASPAPTSAKAFAIFSGGTPPYRADLLDLGSWTALSGAAFTPGLGARTSLSMSLLLALANVRLGYWWNSGIKPRLRGLDKVTFGPWVERVLNVLLPVQTHLLNEVLGRFHGPARMRWYLSDGGHSENTGAYELIRRRLPFIVISDAGRDQKYQFEDLANLVRRVRTDFDAEVAFLTSEQTDALVGATSDIRRYFGDWADFEEKEGGFRGAHALLAYVYYNDPQREGVPGSLILVLKPTLDGDEPLDVRNYAQSKCDFPQESTVDQYFDEAQWESYRRLGEHIASRVFAPKKRVEGADSEGRGPVHEDAPPSSHWRPSSFEAPASVTPFVW